MSNKVRVKIDNALVRAKLNVLKDKYDIETDKEAVEQIIIRHNKLMAYNRILFIKVQQLEMLK